MRQLRRHLLTQKQSFIRQQKQPFSYFLHINLKALPAITTLCKHVVKTKFLAQGEVAMQKFHYCKKTAEMRGNFPSMS